MHILACGAFSLTKIGNLGKSKLLKLGSILS
jgi:hypothetical protein